MVLELYKLIFMARTIARQKLSGKQNLQKDASDQRSVHVAASRQQQIIDAQDIRRSVIVLAPLECSQGLRRALRGSRNHLDKPRLKALAAEHSSNYHTIFHPALSLHQATWPHHHPSLSFLGYNYSSARPPPSLLPFAAALVFKSIQKML